MADQIIDITVNQIVEEVTLNVTPDIIEINVNSITNDTSKISGSGTTNYIPKFTGAGSIGNSLIYDNGTNVGIGTTSPSGKLHVSGGDSVFGTTNLTRILGLSQVIDFTNAAQNAYVDGRINGLSLKLYTNSGSGIDVNSTGNVGIGTTSPSAKLSITGGSTSTSISNVATTLTSVFNTANPAISLGIGYVSSDIPMIQSFNNSNNTSNNLTINPFGGNVGIGTTSPTSKIHSYSTNPYIETQGITSQSDSNIITLGSGSSGSSVYEPNYMGVNESGLLSNKSMRFSIYGAGGSYFKWTNNGSEQMRITSSGNVGIGTTSPVDYSVYGYGANIENRGGRGGGFVSTDSGATNRMVFSVDSSAAVGMVKTVTNTPLTFGVNDSEKVRILNNGNVGIGTTTDAGYKLDVNGTGRFSSDLYSLFFKVTDGYGMHKPTSSTLSLVAGGVVGLTFDGASGATATFSSTVTATGFFNSSDNRLKDLIDYDYNVSDIKPITYLWKDGRDNKKHVGYSAQEVQKVMPDAVNEGTDGMLSVNYVEVLVAKIAELENRIKQLEK